MLFAFSNVLFVAMATRLIIFKEFFFNHVILELLMSLMLLTSSIGLQKVLKNGLNVYKIAKLCIFLWLCDICCHGN